VRLEGVTVPLNFIVDTGASISVISHDLADSPELGNFTRGEKMRVIGAAGVPKTFLLFCFHASLSALTRAKASRQSRLDLDLINETLGFEQAGILGGNFLRNSRLTFRFRAFKSDLRAG
jgi:hypothetical protein